MTVDGKYNVTIYVAGQEKEGIITMAAEGSVLKGVVETIGQHFPFEDGTREDNRFHIEVEGSGQHMTLDGEIAEDGSLSGEGSIGLFEFDFDGNRE